ncbi:orotidine 5'-phosphate decarboxylase [Kwoniella mangroviensis CBS 10435]|uniref:Orotidine 5'-phosphate decarboxylase n=1 Tax=Kwoniella mangroviensis CBS 10435 TaxID=1331196 RepID=A0A1B9J2P8_9TREE|nr:orotidine 5'-phosphate decarboxylase [Kwoniella mangroviensis CBS 8507]OCF62062.1 orotidine 5'-phosphate decarboxylase [Kwoniella mangroviensis CBS 10435]OCF66922.1 orotidine 5'-phosphate decarboxylase [Kwoniella mangroviensis CBS 8507]
MSSPHPTTLIPYSERIKFHTNPTAIKILEIMDRKKTNLAVSVDVNTAKEALEVVRRVGASVCMVKTHCDIFEDFTPAFIEELVRLSKELDFVIFEDRKFADIGNTVSLQYSSGVHKIASWADLTNAHSVPGPGIIAGLAKIGQPLGRGLLLLAEMSSAGSLAVGGYTEQTFKMAQDAGRDFVIGFIAQDRVDRADKIKEGEDYLIMSPGVGLGKKGDSLGQQYRTPRECVVDSGADVIIVGRGIYGVEGGEQAVRDEAERYRQEGWKAYEERLGKK